jgi:membrane protease subunit HflK
MPWSSQNGGGGGGGGPWGQGPQGNQPPDLEELIKRGQNRLKQAMPGGGGGGMFFAILLFIGLAILGYLGFATSIGPNETGLVLRFGKYDPDRTLTSGLNFRLPPPIEQVIVLDTTSRRRQEIGFTTSTSAYSGNQQANSLPAESLMLTGDENIIDIHFVVAWSIQNPAEYQFSMEKPDLTLKAVAESAMREVVGQNKILPLLTRNREETQRDVKAQMQSILDDKYHAGIHVDEVDLLHVSAPVQVSAAFQDVQTARADQESMQNEAKAHANEVVPRARGQAEQILQTAQGYRQQTIDEARGSTDRFLKVYEEYAKAPDSTRMRMYIETMEQVLGSADKIIIDEKAAGTGVVPYLPLSDTARRHDGAAGGK